MKIVVSASGEFSKGSVVLTEAEAARYIAANILATAGLYRLATQLLKEEG